MAHVGSLFCIMASLALAAGCAPDSELPEDQDPAAEERDDALRDGVIADFEHTEVGLITLPGGGYCSGTLIGSRTVLAAAHCFGFGSKTAPASDPPFGTFIMTLPNGKRVGAPYHQYRADAWVIQLGFDIGIAQLDVPVPATMATSAKIAKTWPEDGDTLTVYGYGIYGEDCDNDDAGPKHRRKDIVVMPDDFWHRITCPGDSGGPYFWSGTNQIVAVVKGDGLGVEWVGNVVKYRSWILEQLAASQNGVLNDD